MNRRDFLATGPVAAAAATVLASPAAPRAMLKGRIKHSICR